MKKLFLGLSMFVFFAALYFTPPNKAQATELPDLAEFFYNQYNCTGSRQVVPIYGGWSVAFNYALANNFKSFIVPGHPCQSMESGW